MSIEMKKATEEEKTIKPCYKKVLKNKYIFNMINENRKKIYKIKRDYKNI